MSSASDGSYGSGAMSDLLTRASAVLTREGARMYGGSAGAESLPAAAVASTVGESLLGIAARICPITGASVPSLPPDPSRLREQAHELVAGLLGGAGQPGQFLGAGSEGDRLRRQAHELIESLLATFGGEKREKRGVAEDQVPLLRSPAPVPAGQAARVEFGVANEEDTPSEVTLYCTDFISDSGHEIPALRVTVRPRRATIPARGAAEFEIEVAVPQQTPPGCYSGLIQAMGNRYVKAVLMVEVT
jgi:hypothetical protein